MHGHKHAYALAYILAAAWPAAWVVYCAPCLRRTWTPPYRTPCPSPAGRSVALHAWVDIFPSGNMHEYVRVLLPTKAGVNVVRHTISSPHWVGTAQCSIPAGQCMHTRLSHSFVVLGFLATFFFFFSFFLGHAHTPLLHIHYWPCMHVCSN